MVLIWASAGTHELPLDKSTSLCQQNVEKIIPTYVHGTVIPEMSDLMNRRSESAKIGMLFKFHPSLEYGSSG